MAHRNDQPTDDGSEHYNITTGVSRRRLLQISGVGLAAGTAGAAGVTSGSSELPHSIIIDGSGSPVTASYEFQVSGSVAVHPDIGSNETVTETDGSVTGSVTTDTHAYKFSESLQALDVGNMAEVTLLYGDDGTADVDRLEIVAGSDATIDYEITSPEAVTKVLDNGDRSADDTDSITETSDGWLVDGSTATGSGDTYDFAGAIESIDPVTGDFTLFLNGEETTVTELTGQKADTVDREHWYSVEATGDSYVDYYIEVEDGGEMVASTVDDAIIESDFYWLNDDKTKAAGRVHAGDTHAYAFDTLVLDVTIEGEAAATVDGNPSDLDYYPQPGATGDHWKGYFPWQIDGETRKHWYSIEATGEEYVDYYIEVKDGGAIIPSTVDESVIEYEFFWIGDNGTKAAGRVQAGDTHAYAFDTGLLDVTVDGEADATVNGKDSDLDWYPRPNATGDGWKGGFPWQDDGDGVTTEPSGDGTVGGGDGYANTVSQSSADIVVRTRSELRDGLAAADDGDLVYLPGDVSIDMGSREFDVPDGVTLASDRGIDGSAGALIATDQQLDFDPVLNMYGESRVTGIRLRGPNPDPDDWGGDGSRGIDAFGAAEVDNNEIWGWAHGGIQSREGSGAHFHHNVIRHNNRSGLGYGVIANAGSPVIEYNYFNYNRHSVATPGDNPGYVCRYNHFGPKEVMHNIDAHDPAGTYYDIHNNVVENIYKEWDGGRNHAVDIRGVPDDLATIHDNWFFNDNAPDPNGEPDENGQTIVQETVSEWTNVEFSNNAYGEDADVSYSDIIPGYDGWRS